MPLNICHSNTFRISSGSIQLRIKLRCKVTRKVLLSVRQRLHEWSELKLYQASSVHVSGFKYHYTNELSAKWSIFMGNFEAKCFNFMHWAGEHDDNNPFLFTNLSLTHIQDADCILCCSNRVEVKQFLPAIFASCTKKNTVRISGSSCVKRVCISEIKEKNRQNHNLITLF